MSDEVQDPNPEFGPVALVPVSQWVFNLYRVQFWTDETKTRLALDYPVFCQTTDTHIKGEVEDRWPNDTAKWASWEVVKENIGNTRVVGQFYNLPINEDGWTAGEAMAERLGFKDQWRRERFGRM